MNINYFDKRIFKLKDSEDSKGGITALGGFVVEVDKIMPHIKSASDNLIVSIKKKMIKKDAIAYAVMEAI